MKTKRSPIQSCLLAVALLARPAVVPVSVAHWHLERVLKMGHFNHK
jgi:hypothetical protein